METWTKFTESDFSSLDLHPNPLFDNIKQNSVHLVIKSMFHGDIFFHQKVTKYPFKICTTFTKSTEVCFCIFWASVAYFLLYDIFSPNVDYLTS